MMVVVEEEISRVSERVCGILTFKGLRKQELVQDL